jgi:hypothetical protein
MINSEPSKTADLASAPASMADYRQDLPAIIRQIRVCRSMLGAILDELDDGDRNPAVEKVAECATVVAAEIESLWEAIKLPG